MIRKAKEALICFTILAIVSALGIAQQPQTNYSKKQLKIMMASAATADDYRKLSTYFHLQELMFRTKAQKTLDEYASHGGKYPMATKTVSRADVASREYDSCISKAEDNARLAARYDEILMGLGIQPATVSAATVSVQSLRNSGPESSSAALPEKGPSRAN